MLEFRKIKGGSIALILAGNPRVSLCHKSSEQIEKNKKCMQW